MIIKEFKILSRGKKWAFPIILESKDNFFEKKNDFADFQIFLSIRDHSYSDFAVSFENRKYTLFPIRKGVKIGVEPPSPIVKYYPIFFQPMKPSAFCLSIGNFSKYKINILERSKKKYFKLSNEKLLLLPPKNKNEEFVFSLSS